MRKVTTIVREVEAIVPSLVQRCDEAEEEAAIEREHGREEQARRLAEARKASRQQLLAIVDDWSLARNIESFFEDAEHRASTLPAEELAATRERLSRARDVFSGTNVLDRFHEWKSPDVRE